VYKQRANYIIKNLIIIIGLQILFQTVIRQIIFSGLFISVAYLLSPYYVTYKYGTIINSDSINAFSIWTPFKNYIGITKGAIQRLDSESIRWLYYHEKSHIYHYDSVKTIAIEFVTISACLVCISLSLFWLAAILTAIITFMSSYIYQYVCYLSEYRADKFATGFTTTKTSQHTIQLLGSDSSLTHPTVEQRLANLFREH
jgi:Zn-dependent protease with chaperone function